MNEAKSENENNKACLMNRFYLRVASDQVLALLGVRLHRAAERLDLNLNLCLRINIRAFVSMFAHRSHLTVPDDPELLDPAPREDEDGPGRVDDEPGSQLCQRAVAALERLHIELAAAHDHGVEAQGVAGWISRSNENKKSYVQIGFVNSTENG